MRDDKKQKHSPYEGLVGINLANSGAPEGLSEELIFRLKLKESACGGQEKWK